VGAVGAADHIGSTCSRSSDEVYVVSIELFGDEPRLLRQTVEQVLACASGELVDDLADRSVVEGRLRR
jgi:hypothetical protein